jgi:ATP synthase protein I
MSAEPDGPGRRDGVAVAGRLLAIAWEFIGAVVAGVLVGWFADEKLGTAPWLLIGFTLLGTCAGFYQMVRMLRTFERHG